MKENTQRITDVFDVDRPLVSVVIPTYNRPDLVIRAVISVLNQTYTNIEVIVVDDNSDVDIESVLKKYDQVRFFKNKENKGANFSRNVGLKHAKGDYINFLDDDDVFLNEKIEKQINCFKNSMDPNLGMVTSHAIDQRSGKKYKKINSVKGDIYKKLLQYYAVSGTETMLFKTKYIKEIEGFDEDLLSNHEYDLLIRFSEKFTVDFVDEVLSEENRSYGQINISFDRRIIGAIMLFKKNSPRFKKQGLLFWLKMQLKLLLLLIRFYIGKVFGEKIYRFLLFEGRRNQKLTNT